MDDYNSSVVFNGELNCDQSLKEIDCCNRKMIRNELFGSFIHL